MLVSVTVSAAVAIPVTCPLLSSKTSCIYVLLELLDELAAEIDGWAVKYAASFTAFGVRALVWVESMVLVNIVMPEADVLAVKALKVVLSN